MTVEGGKAGDFYQPEQGLDVGKYYHLFLLANGLVKMPLKGVENREQSGFHNAPQYSSEDGKNGKFSKIIRDASCVVSDASDKVRD